jgi:hypothetical protein
MAGKNRLSSIRSGIFAAYCSYSASVALSLLLDALESHRARQSEERLFLGDAWQDHGLVFPDHWHAAKCAELAEPRIWARCGSRI